MDKILPVHLAAEEMLFVTLPQKPGCFYAKLVSRSVKDLNGMAAELMEAYSNPNPPLLYADFQSHLGQYGVLHWGVDNKFYRICVTKEHLNMAEVHFIDYGNYLCIQQCEILAPLESLTCFNQPPYGIHCMLEDRVTLSFPEWSDLILEQSIEVKIGKCVDEIYSVTLTNHPFNKKIVKAIFPIIPSKRKVLENQQSPHMEPSTPVPAKIVSETEITNKCVPFRINIGSDHFTMNDFSKNMLSNRVTSCKETALKQLIYPQQILPRSNTSVMVVCLDDPTSFYVQLSESCSSVTNMTEKLNEVYSDKLKPAIQNAKPGSACVVQYDVDNKWYRGKILKFNDPPVTFPLVTVLFVDYGYTQRSSLKVLKAIDEEFVQLPPQAFHCRLSGLGNTRAWTVEEKNIFKACCMNKALNANFADQDSEGKFPLCLVNKIEMSSINNFLCSLKNSTSVSLPSVGYSFLPLSKTAVEVSIAWYYNPGRIFINPVDLSAYQNALFEFEEFYSSLPPGELLEDQPSVGLPCVAQFIEDGRHYRSQILSIHHEMAEILFVDYGNQQDTPLSLLKRMIPPFMQCPQLTWQSKLKGVKKIVSGLSNPESQKHLDVCFLSGQTLSALIHPISPDGRNGVFEVDLNIPGIGDAAQYLIQKRVVDGTSETETNYLVTGSVNYSPGQLISFSALATYIKSHTEIWVQLEPDIVDIVMDQIAAQNVSQFAVIKPSIGSYCLALLSNRLWYRAVVNSFDKDQANVTLFDYGNSFILDLEDLRVLPNHLAQYPKLALKCALDGTQTNCISPPTVNQCMLTIYEQILSVVFVSRTPENVYVRLYSSTGNDLNEKLGLSGNLKIKIVKDTHVGKNAIELNVTYGQSRKEQSLP